MEEYKPKCSKSNTVHFGCGICKPLDMKTTPDTTGIEKELLRLASLVGTDAKNPKEKLLAYFHHQLQKARHDWLREIEEVMRVDIGDASPTRLALQALLYRHQEELNKQ